MSGLPPENLNRVSQAAATDGELSENRFFDGSYGGDNRKISSHTRLECKICWYEYNPEQGDAYWQIPPGTPFSQLPEHWVCPECGGKKDDFLVIDT